jgi:hypothetical protein
MSCASSCPTQDHATYGECLRSKNLKVGWAASHKGLDRSTDKAWEKNLEDYRSARKQGIQPSSTQPGAVRAAVEASNATGTAFQA